MHRLKTVATLLTHPGVLRTLPAQFCFPVKGELRPQSACPQPRADETCVVFSEFCRALSLTPRAKIVAKQIARLFHICVRARASFGVSGLRVETAGYRSTSNPTRERARIHLEKAIAMDG